MGRKRPLAHPVNRVVEHDDCAGRRRSKGHAVCRTTSRQDRSTCLGHRPKPSRCEIQSPHGRLDRRFQYAFRTLRRQPTFTIVAILTLALGIGANTAIFSVIKTVVLNPLPYESPEKIAILWEVNPDGNQGPVSVPTFEDWKREAKTFESLAAYRHVDFSFKGTGDPQNVPALGRRRICSTSSRATPRSGARSPRTKPSSAPIASSCSATASGRARWRAMRQ